MDVADGDLQQAVEETDVRLEHLHKLICAFNRDEQKVTSVLRAQRYVFTLMTHDDPAHDCVTAQTFALNTPLLFMQCLQYLRRLSCADSTLLSMQSSGSNLHE